MIAFIFIVVTFYVTRIEVKKKMWSKFSNVTSALRVANEIFLKKLNKELSLSIVAEAAILFPIFFMEKKYLPTFSSLTFKK